MGKIKKQVRKCTRAKNLIHLGFVKKRQVFKYFAKNTSATNGFPFFTQVLKSWEGVKGAFSSLSL